MSPIGLPLAMTLAESLDGTNAILIGPGTGGPLGAAGALLGAVLGAAPAGEGDGEGDGLPAGLAGGEATAVLAGAAGLVGSAALAGADVGLGGAGAQAERVMARQLSRANSRTLVRRRLDESTSDLHNP
jgi:hypothetical protein